MRSIFSTAQRHLWASVLVSTLAVATTLTAQAATTVRIGVQADNPGTTYLDESGKMAGYEVDVLNEVFKRIPDHEIDYRTMDFATLFVSLATNKVDLITSNIKRNPERENQYLFTEEDFYRTPYKLVVQQDNAAINSFADMNGRKIAVLGTGVQAKVLADYIERHNLDLEVLPSKSNTEMVTLLTSGRVDSIFLPEHQALVFNKYRGTTLRLVGNGLIPAGKKPEEFGAHFLLRKDNTELRDKIDTALRSMRADGTLSQLSEKWFGKDLTGNFPVDE